MPWSWSNIDWTVTGTITAAWMQAVGSVAAVAGAAWVGVYQARQARELAAEQERQRADELLRERVALLQGASTNAHWAANRLKELETVLKISEQAPTAGRYLPVVAQQFGGLQGRVSALGFAQVPSIAREKLFALEHYLSATAGYIAMAISDLREDGADAARVCLELAESFHGAQKRIDEVASDLMRISKELHAHE